MKSNYHVQLNKKYDWNCFDRFHKPYLTRIKGKFKWYVHDKFRYPVKVSHIGDCAYVARFKLVSKHSTIRSYGIEK